MREALAGLQHQYTTSAVAQSTVSALLIPVSDIQALVPRPIVAQLLHDTTVTSALLASPAQRTLPQRSLIAERVKESAALATLPELQRNNVALAGEFMRVPSGSCVFYQVLLHWHLTRAHVVGHVTPLFFKGDASTSVFLVLSGCCSISIDVDR